MSATNGRTGKRSRYAWLEAVIKLEIEPTAKAVATALWLHTDAGGVAFPSVEALARKASLSGRTVQRALGTLDGLGLLVRCRPDAAMRKRMAAAHITRADRLPNAYALNLDGVTQATPREGGNGVTRAVGRSGPRGDTRCANGVTPLSPKQLIEQPIKSTSYRGTAAKPPPAPPKQPSKPPAKREPRKRDALFEAVCELFDLETKTKGGQRRVGALARDFGLLEATPDELVRRRERYRAAWPDVEDTPDALLKHWNRFATDKAPTTKATHVDGGKFAALNGSNHGGTRNGKLTLATSLG